MLEHYRDDDEKRNAARFVIVNMVGATGSDKSVEDACDEFYEKYDSLMRIHGYDSLSAIFDYGKMSVWDKQVDSLWADYEAQHKAELMHEQVSDIETLSAEYVIGEIDMACEAWKENVHARGCSWDEFCEYVLPYRRKNGVIADDARKRLRERHRGRYFVDESKDIMAEVDSLMSEYRHVTHSGFAGMSIPVLSVGVMERLRHGLCEQRCWMNTMILSSMGMACATDFVPVWGNRNNSHTWNVVIRNGESYAFESFWDEDRWKYKRIYNNRECDSVWGVYRLPKVYRRTFKRYREGPMADESVDVADIPLFFRDERKKDVSKEYFETTDVMLNVEIGDKTVKYVYLCVLNYGGWSAVQWGKLREDGKVIFEDMGRGIVYMPMYCRNGMMLACGNPIIVNAKGEVESVRAETERERVTVSHYTGALGYVKSKVTHGDVTGSLLVDENGDSMCVLPDGWELKSVSVDTKCKKVTRRVTMVLPRGVLALGRLEFHSKADGEMRKIEGVKVVSNVAKTSNGERVCNVLDESSSTGYCGKIEGGKVEFDLGGKYIVEKVVVCPYLHSGFNAGVEYELCYWDGRWRSVDRKTGGGVIEFENAPKGALLIVRPSENTGRMGFRPFRYVNGEVEWW